MSVHGKKCSITRIILLFELGNRTDEVSATLIFFSVCPSQRFIDVV